MRWLALLLFSMGFGSCSLATDRAHKTSVMCVGDSITRGNHSSDPGYTPDGLLGGYRSKLFSKRRAANKAIALVGPWADGPDLVDGVTFDRQHAGFNSHEVSAIQTELVNASALAYSRPEVILLHAGTVDIISNPTGIATRMGTLIDYILGILPNVKLSVAQIITMASHESDVAAYNSALATVVASKSGVHLFDCNTAFLSGGVYNSSLYLADGIHLNNPGDEVLSSIMSTEVAYWEGVLGR